MPVSPVWARHTLYGQVIIIKKKIKWFYKWIKDTLHIRLQGLHKISNGHWIIWTSKLVHYPQYLLPRITFLLYIIMINLSCFIVLHSDIFSLVSLMTDIDKKVKLGSLWNALKMIFLFLWFIAYDLLLYSVHQDASLFVN